MQFDKNDFFRKAGQLGYNLTLGSTVRHTIHAGYQRYADAEDLERSSNGWGTITVPGGRISFQGRPDLLPGGLPAAGDRRGAGDPLGIPVSQSIEVNDTIAGGNWSFNVGVLASNDTLYGQGLRNDSSTLSGFVLARPAASTRCTRFRSAR